MINSNNNKITIKIINYLNKSTEIISIIPENGLIHQMFPDYFQKNSYKTIVTTTTTTTTATTAAAARKLFYTTHPKEYQYFLNELKYFQNFRKILLKNQNKRKQIILIQLKLVPEKEFVDYRGNRIVNYSVWEKVETDIMLSWLSTLGGGYSALGERFTECAKIAAKISLKQLATAIRIGDPFLEARCKLFYSISLIQTNKLRFAKKLIREQYSFAKTQKETDERLLKMCKGAWLKLQYSYFLRIQKKLKLES